MTQQKQSLVAEKLLEVYRSEPARSTAYDAISYPNGIKGKSLDAISDPESKQYQILFCNGTLFNMFREALVGKITSEQLEKNISSYIDKLLTNENLRAIMQALNISSELPDREEKTKAEIKNSLYNKIASVNISRIEIMINKTIYPLLLAGNFNKGIFDNYEKIYMRLMMKPILEHKIFSEWIISQLTGDYKEKCDNIKDNIVFTLKSKIFKYNHPIQYMLRCFCSVSFYYFFLGGRKQSNALKRLELIEQQLMAERQSTKATALLEPQAQEIAQQPQAQGTVQKPPEKNKVADSSNPLAVAVEYDLSLGV